ncbi:MAG: M28 family peptidase [Armatimonadetes bacterium]|nr:M28 family peptidase [Armatimonadota bacterium]
MTDAEIRTIIKNVDAGKLEAHVRYLAEDPLPRRTLNFTLPGHEKCTLHEADDYIAAQLASWGYSVEREGVQVQAFRRDRAKPKASQYSPPLPEDPWYIAYNLYAKKAGTQRPEDIIVVVSHKDSQSWCASPGANDNAIGTAANMELARVLADTPIACSVWFLYCNEEHWPWTSVNAAQGAKERGENLIAIFNLDGLGRKSYADTRAGRMKNVTLFTTPEGERIADLIAEVNERFNLGLEQSKYQRPAPGDDDGSFVKAGYPAAVANIGSYPYADPCYHCECDVPDNCDFENAALTTQAILATMLVLCRG